jgi:DNA-binding response OmpR family regulator
LNTILLVEDEPQLAQVIVRELEGVGYRVLHAPDGFKALETFSAEQPNLVILDWLLPAIDGLEVLQHLRRTSAVPVLMLTARGEETDRVVGLEVGADDYLTKPFSMRELIARVRALLRRIDRVKQIIEADRSSGETFVVQGRLSLDPGGYRVTLDGEPLDLTRSEFDLLHLLLRNPGRAFSRTYLLDAIWGESYVAGDRSVDNAVLRLRRKLGSHAKVIETVWGIGYRLRPER